MHVHCTYIRKENYLLCYLLFSAINMDLDFYINGISFCRNDVLITFKITFLKITFIIKEIVYPLVKCNIHSLTVPFTSYFTSFVNVSVPGNGLFSRLWSLQMENSIRKRDRWIEILLYINGKNAVKKRGFHLGDKT